MLERAEMGKYTTTDREQVGVDGRGYRVMAAEKKVVKKKAGKKTAAKKAASAKKKGKAAKAAKTAAESAPVAASSAPKPEPAFVPPSDEARSGGAMRGIIALWGPLAIIVLLIVVSRLGDEEPGAFGDRAAAGLSASLETAESIARDVVEDVQDALTGGDPQAAAVLDTRASGRSSSGSTSGDLAAAFYDAGAASAPPPPPSSSKQAATAADVWGQSDQTTTPASLSGIPGALPPHPENPWAPMDPRSATAMSADPYSQAYPPAYSPAYPQAGAIPPPVAPYGYGVPPQSPAYPPLPPDYGSAPPSAYGGRPPGYSQQQAYGMAPPAYGAPPAYAYPPQPYGAPAPYPYPPGYYPPPQ